jgi:hypothetical protein
MVTLNKAELTLTAQVGKPSATRKVWKGQLNRRGANQKWRRYVTRMNHCYTHQLLRSAQKNSVASRVQAA